MHILFVDDIADTRHLFSMAFVLAGHRCQTAADASEGLSLLKRTGGEPFDAAVLDMHMPDMDGMEMLRQIKLMPEAQQLVIIMHTAYHTPEIEKKAKDAGAYACLHKPILTPDLIDVVESAVERSRRELQQNPS
jgi:CheY-like chemotaxis protein